MFHILSFCEERNTSETEFSKKKFKKWNYPNLCEIFIDGGKYRNSQAKQVSGNRELVWQRTNFEVRNPEQQKQNYLTMKNETKKKKNQTKQLQGKQNIH